MSEQKTHLDMADVEDFLNDYDYWGGDGWIAEILNGNIDLQLMQKAIRSHAKGDTAECQMYVDDMFKEKWWDKAAT